MANDSAQPLIDAMMRFESGEMSNEQAVHFFQSLVDSGMINHLQGVYGRTAQALLDRGLIKAPTSEHGDA